MLGTLGHLEAYALYLMMLSQSAGKNPGLPGTSKQGPVMDLHPVQLGLTLTLLKC